MLARCRSATCHDKGISRPFPSDVCKSNRTIWGANLLRHCRHFKEQACSQVPCRYEPPFVRCFFVAPFFELGLSSSRSIKCVCHAPPVGLKNPLSLYRCSNEAASRAGLLEGVAGAPNLRIAPYSKVSFRVGSGACATLAHHSEPAKPPPYKEEPSWRGRDGRRGFYPKTHI